MASRWRRSSRYSRSSPAETSPGGTASFPILTSDRTRYRPGGEVTEWTGRMGNNGNSPPAWISSLLVPERMAYGSCGKLIIFRCLGSSFRSSHRPYGGGRKSANPEGIRLSECYLSSRSEVLPLLPAVHPRQAGRESARRPSVKRAALRSRLSTLSARELAHPPDPGALNGRAACRACSPGSPPEDRSGSPESPACPGRPGARGPSPDR